MYYEHFGFKRAPFGITPDTQLFYAGGQRGDILAALLYAITHGEGIVKVVGEVGSGKTMLCRMLETQMPASVHVVYLSNPRIDPADVIYAIVGELHMPVATDAPRLQVQNALHEYLLQRHAQNQRVVVFVEEAQGMPLETLEEIRLLTNLETETEKLLQIVLFGQPELDTHLADTRIRQLRERITHSFNLGPLAPTVVAEYVKHRLRAAGHPSGDVFDASALRMLARASQGLMRRINILADKALLAAFAGQQTRVAQSHVKAALHDSEFATTRIPSRFWLAGFGIGIAVAVFVWIAIPTTEPAITARAGDASAPENVTNAAVPEATAPVPTVDGDFIAARIDVTREWLQQADERHFSIQVYRVNADAMRDLERFLRAQESSTLLDRLFICPVQRNGQTVYRVLYNEYADYADAKAAMDALPADVKRYKPFLRSIRQVRATVDDNGSS